MDSVGMVSKNTSPIVKKKLGIHIFPNLKVGYESDDYA